MQYRIKEVISSEGYGEVLIQCKGSWGGWRNIWRRRFMISEHDYALMCAQELKEHLEERI